MTMKKPDITKECVKQLLDTPFIRVYDLQYEEGRHYYDVTRRTKENLVATKPGEAFKKMAADAVSCIVILEAEGEEPRLLLNQEFRYPAGQFLLGVPAGLLDAKDYEQECPVLFAARREIKEETGLDIAEGDSLTVVNPLLFSTPGMTDESNALVCAVLHLKDFSALTDAGAEETECIKGYSLLTKKDAERMFKNGRDDDGMFYSVWTWTALIYFLTDMWKHPIA